MIVEEEKKRQLAFDPLFYKRMLKISHWDRERGGGARNEKVFMRVIRTEAFLKKKIEFN